MSNKLYLVPTPIGNLEDISFRAVRVLKESDLILAEDTRKSSILLKKYEIPVRLESYHKFNEHKIIDRYVEMILSGKQISLVTDAGTPGISDPGFLIVRACIEAGVEVECLPGATAFVPALVNSGLPSERFVFEGFLPQKKGRKKRFEQLAEETRTLVFYESPYRLIKTLEQLGECFSFEHHVSVSRELTKIHEENFRGTVAETIQHFSNKAIKGEIVIVFSPKL